LRKAVSASLVSPGGIGGEEGGGGGGEEGEGDREDSPEGEVSRGGGEGGEEGAGFSSFFTSSFFGADFAFSIARTCIELSVSPLHKKYFKKRRRRRVE